MILNTIILITCVVINVQELLVKKLGLTSISYFDEAICLAAYIVCPLAIRKTKDSWIYIILALPALSTLHGIIINYAAFSTSRLTETMLQSIINFKLFLYFALLYCLRERFGAQFSKVFTTCITISLIGYVANVLDPSYFNFSDESWQIERNRISGFQFKPNDLAIMLAFAFIYSIFSQKSTRAKIIISTTLLCLVYFTGSRTALVVALTALGIHISFQKKSGSLLLTAPIALIALLLGYEQLTGSFYWQETISNITQLSSVNQTQYIRAIMIYYGFFLAITFPSGVGAGNFGSVMSSGSPAYDMLGVSGTYFFQNMIGIYDSNLAAILGEYGFIGVIILTLLTLKIINHTIKDQKAKKAALIASVLILSITQPVFAYHVNSINLLLLIFSLAQQKQSKPQAAKLRNESPSYI